MKGMAGLEELFREMNQKKANSAKGGHIERGLIRGNFVVIGSKSYPYTSAVDINILEGMYVWCELTSNHLAVIVGA